MRGVSTALILELIGAAAYVAIDDGLNTIAPMRCGRLSVFYNNTADIALQAREELVEVGQRIAYKRARCGHGLLRTDAVMTNDIDDIIARSAFGYLAVAVHAHIVGGIVHIVVVDHKHLAEVEGAAALRSISLSRKASVA